MPRTRTYPKPGSTSKTDTLRAFWRMGRNASKRVVTVDSGGRSLDSESVAKQAQAVGMTAAALRSAIRIAKQYDALAIEQICERIEKSGARFGPTHLTRLLAIKNRTRRARIVERAILEQWGLRRLDREIQAVAGTRFNVGRRPSVPKGKKAVLAALLALTVKWTRWCAEARGTLPEDVRDLVDEATAKVEQVGQRIVEVVGVR